MNGSSTPARASRRSEPSADGQLATECRTGQGSDDVGSHGDSHASLRMRSELHAGASRSRGGRMPTRPCRSRAGQPGCRVMVRCAVLVTPCCQGLASSSGTTVTWSPSDTSVTSSSITMRQLAWARPASRCEPVPAHRLDGVAAVRLAMQQAATVLPAARR